jgi:hypothetical protein
VIVAGACGAFCRACPLYIASTEAPERLASFGKPLADVTCHGCRSDVLSASCRSCKVRACAAAKGVVFCAECAEWPCAEVATIAVKSVIEPGHLERDGQMIRAQGREAWAAAKVADHACPSCGAINSAYSLACWRCGHDPSCAFVSRNRDAIVRLLAPK